MLKPLSDELQKQLISALKHKNRFLALLMPSNHLLELLSNRELWENPSAIKFLIEFALGNDEQVAYRALEIIKDNTRHLTTSQWTYLAEDVKTYDYWVPRKKWYSLTKNDLKIASRFKEYETIFLGLLSFHNNGYVREQALKELDNIYSGEENLFVLLRLNDWVTQIRDRAEKALIKRITDANTLFFIKHLPLVYRLAICERKDHSKVIGKVEELLKKHENEAALLEIVNEQDKEARRVSYELLLQIPRVNVIEVIEIGLRHTDTVIQSKAVKRLFSIVTTENGCRFYSGVKKNRSSNIRKNAPKLLEYCTGLDTVNELKSFLLDSSPSIRDLTRYLLNQQGFTDYRSVYINAIEEGKQLFGAISGLEETGAKEDADLLFPFLYGDNTKLQKASLKAVSRLNPIEYKDAFYEFLVSPVKGISKEARQALENNRGLIDEILLEQILNNEQIPDYVISNINLLLKKLSKWNALLLLLKLLGNPFPLVQQRVNCELLIWFDQFNRSFIKPSQKQIEEVKWLVQKYRDRIYEDNLRKIKTVI